MKIIEKMPVVYLEDFDIHVNKYLTYAQIQQIVNSVVSVMNETNEKSGSHYDSWCDMEQSVDLALLYHATDLSNDDLINNSHTVFLQSGLIDAVKDSVVNFHQVAEALEYTTGTRNTVLTIIKGVTKILKNVNPKTLLRTEAKDAMQE